jgi:hypothetical protein
VPLLLCSTEKNGNLINVHVSLCGVCARNCAYTCASVLKLGTGIYTQRFRRQVHDYSRDNGGSTSVLAQRLTMSDFIYLFAKKRPAFYKQNSVLAGVARPPSSPREFPVPDHLSVLLLNSVLFCVRLYAHMPYV